MVLPDIHSETIVNKNSTIKWIGEDIIFVYYNDNTVLEVSDLEESLAAYNNLSRGRQLKVLSVFGDYSSATNEARKFGENIDLNASAEAMVFSGLAQRLLLKFFNTLRKQKHPLKIFQNKQAALDWLNSFE